MGCSGAASHASAERAAASTPAPHRALSFVFPGRTSTDEVNAIASDLQKNGWLERYSFGFGIEGEAIPCFELRHDLPQSDLAKLRQMVLDNVTRAPEDAGNHERDRCGVDRPFLRDPSETSRRLLAVDFTVAVGSDIDKVRALTATLIGDGTIQDLGPAFLFPGNEARPGACFTTMQNFTQPSNVPAVLAAVTAAARDAGLEDFRGVGRADCASPQTLEYAKVTLAPSAPAVAAAAALKTALEREPLASLRRAGVWLTTDAPSVFESGLSHRIDFHSVQTCADFAACKAVDAAALALRPAGCTGPSFDVPGTDPTNAFCFSSFTSTALRRPGGKVDEYSATTGAIEFDGTVNGVDGTLAAVNAAANDATLAALASLGATVLAVDANGASFTTALLCESDPDCTAKIAAMKATPDVASVDIVADLPRPN
jgi:hypothetical protein